MSYGNRTLVGWINNSTMVAVAPRRRQWHPLQYSCLDNPWVEEPGGLQSMGSLESDTTERLHFHFSLSCIGEGNGNPLVFLPGESHGWGSLVGFRLWGCTESDMTEVT